MSIRVVLLAHTPSPDTVVASSARICYSECSAADLVDGAMNAAHTAHFIESLLQSGHMSPFEHANFTFAVDGISRVCSHQLVRHRIASFSQQSQRYVKMNSAAVILPPAIAASEEAACIFRSAVEESYRCYERLLQLGVSREDARYILPHGWETKLVVTMNARELHHFFALRLCRRAQWEIQNLAKEMLRRARAAAPVLFNRAGPPCAVGDVCRERHSCGRPFGSMEELLEHEDA